MATIKSREQLQAEEKKLIGEIEKKHGKPIEQLYAEREKRVLDAIELRQPDRVPFQAGGGVFACRYSGLPVSVMYYDHAAYREACKKMLLDFEPDVSQDATFNSGFVLEALDARHQRWPGGNLPPDVPYQFVEGEYMKADEYDWFLSDPSDFVMRAYLPRIYGILGPLSKLPPFRTMVGGQGFTALLGLFTRPEFIQLAEKLAKASQEQEKFRQNLVDFGEEIARLGFPSRGNGNGIPQAPFDTVSDHLRGMRGSMIDMYRCPEKILAATDKILEWRISRAQPANPNTRGKPKRQSMPLHRGSDGFMSIKQFETFYWPTLKKAILHNIELGYVPTVAWEGIWDERLEYLLELPKGKVVGSFERSNIFKVKEVLGDHQCIVSRVPSSLMEVGSPQEVEEYCQKLIKVVGKGGGYIMGAGGIDNAKPANVKAMADSVQKYGWY